MPSSPTALDLTKLHLNKFLQHQYTPTSSQDLSKAQIALDNEEKKLFLNKKLSQKISPSLQNNYTPQSNNALTEISKSNLIEDKTLNDNQQMVDYGKIMTQGFNNLHRPLPQHLRPREFDTKRMVSYSK